MTRATGFGAGAALVALTGACVAAAHRHEAPTVGAHTAAVVRHESAAAPPGPTPATTKPATPAVRRTPTVHPGGAAWTRSAVATVWIKPGKVRRIDHPALTRRPHLGRWLAHQTLAQREDLGQRIATQSLRGDRLHVVGRRDDWTRVRVPQQRGSFFDHGIIGWVPTAQLSGRRVGSAAHTPSGRTGGTAALAVARRYLGTPYLWGGMSKRGIDCSALTYLAYAAQGVRLDRDAADQARQGHPVAKTALRPGDLVFFSSGGRAAIHHVGLYAGDGLVLHAPHTGETVHYTPLSAWSDYWGARRVG